MLQALPDKWERNFSIYLFHSQDEGASWSIKLIYVTIQAKPENLQRNTATCGFYRSDNCVSSEEP